MIEIVITSSVLIVTLLVLRYIFAKKVSRVLIYGAWALVALRLLIPVQIGQLPFSVLTLTKAVTQAVEHGADRQVAGYTEGDALRDVLLEYVENDRSAFTPAVKNLIQSAADNNASGEEIVEKIQGSFSREEIFVPEVRSQVAEKVDRAKAPITLGNILTVVWLAGVAVMVIWFAAANLGLRRRLRGSEKRVDIQSCIPVYVSEKANSPCLIGFFFPEIYLTPQCAENEKTLAYVMTHEQTHYAHWDHLWALVRSLCLCLYWFHPLVWVAAWYSRRDCELACDEGALKRLGDPERIAYGNALLKVVSETSLSGKLMLTATTMAETKKQLKQRILLISRKPKWSVYALVCMALVCAVVTGCAVVGPGGEVAQTERKPWEVSEELKTQIKEDYYANMLSHFQYSCTVQDVNLIVVGPAGEGYAMFIGCQCSSFDPNPSWEEFSSQFIDELRFYMPKGWDMRYYAEGEFMSLKNAYNKGNVSYNELTELFAVYYEQFPIAWAYWQYRNPDAPTIPQRDPSGLDYKVNEDGVTCTVTGRGTNRDTELVIPEYIDGYRVTVIGESAIWPRRGITSVVMPNSVVRIEQGAFKFCEELQSVTLSNRLEYIGFEAFAECYKLKNIEIPASVKKIGSMAFYNCTSLTAFTIPEGITHISGGMLGGCTGITSVEIPDSVTVIYAAAFADCIGLKKITIGTNVTAMGEGVFAGCSNYTQIYYMGTQVRWKEICKSIVGMRNEPFVIHCADGDLVVEGKWQ